MDANPPQLTSEVDASCVGVSVGQGHVGVALGSGTAVGMNAGVIVMVGVTVGGDVAVGDGLRVAVEVTVGGMVADAEGTTVTVEVAVIVGVGVSVSVGVGVGVPTLSPIVSPSMEASFAAMGK